MVQARVIRLAGHVIACIISKSMKTPFMCYWLYCIFIVHQFETTTWTWVNDLIRYGLWSSLNLEWYSETVYPLCPSTPTKSNKISLLRCTLIIVINRMWVQNVSKGVIWNVSSHYHCLTSKYTCIEESYSIRRWVVYFIAIRHAL